MGELRNYLKDGDRISAVLATASDSRGPLLRRLIEPLLALSDALSRRPSAGEIDGV